MWQGHTLPKTPSSRHFGQGMLGAFVGKRDERGIVVIGLVTSTIAFPATVGFVSVIFQQDLLTYMNQDDSEPIVTTLELHKATVIVGEGSEQMSHGVKQGVGL
jgi:hypothetical protein